jgi:hypothetical protein
VGQLRWGLVGLTDRVLAEALQTTKGLRWAFHHHVFVLYLAFWIYWGIVYIIGRLCQGVSLRELSSSDASECVF